MKELRDWFIFHNRLYGKIYNDERFTDGDNIVTSTVLLLDGDTVITKSGTEYKLGEQAK